jgi:L,D-peptidoglycan transpeptidase YkuD (ErfK/YbiS/YcfS/YnhG family)
MTRTIGVSACLLLGVAAPAGGGHQAGTSCPPNLASRLAETREAEQLVTVVAPSKPATSASLRLWRKAGECWLAAGGPWPARLGRNGLSENRREGDKTTPIGAFGFQRVIYGVGPNPGVRYAYHRIVCGDWWVEDPRSPFYNRFRHVRCGAKPPFRTTSEDMSRSPTSYRHLAVIDFNTHPIVPGRGSGIFLHVSTGRPTLGCISVPRAQLVAVLRWLDPAASPLIVIGTARTIGRS